MDTVSSAMPLNTRTRVILPYRSMQQMSQGPRVRKPQLRSLSPTQAAA